MARYIDADALIEKIDKEQTALETNNSVLWEINRKYWKGLAMARAIIDEQPTASVAPRAEVAREIFEEIEKIIKSPRTVGFCMTAPSFRQAISDYNEGIRKEILYYIAALQKKYTEEN